MRFEVLPEPDLEFGAGCHIDIRYGIRDYGPLGFDKSASPQRIQIGFVGTPVTISGVVDWMNRARIGILATPSKKPRFRPEFPGFGLDSSFRCEWVTEQRLQRPIQQREITALLAINDKNAAIEKAADLFIDECRYLNEAAKVDVIICAPPADLLRHFDNDRDADEEDESRPRPLAGSRRRKLKQRAARFTAEWDFHDLLKARSLTLNSPIQFIRPSTYDESHRKNSSK
jgi:hypothetical protein